MTAPTAPALPATQVMARARRRRFSFSMFEDIVPGARFDFTEVPAMKRTLLLTFDRDLTPTEAQAVADRLASTDDDDLADRAALRELEATVGAMKPTPEINLLLRVARRLLDA